MKRNVLKAVQSGVSYAKAFTFLALVALVSAPVMAAGDEIVIPQSAISWEGIGENIMEAVKEPLLAGIGVGIAIWLVQLAPRLLKRTAR